MIKREITMSRVIKTLRSNLVWSAVALWVICISATYSVAEEAVVVDPISQIAQDSASLRVAADTLWVLMAGALVFFMNTGFGMLESGLCRQKNTVNILAKNFIVFALATVSFYALGWGLMFGDGNAFLGIKGLIGLTGSDNSPATGDAYVGVYSSIGWAGVPLWAKFFFQLVFAATAATIVSGVVAERVKFVSFIVFSVVLVAVFYPITGHWIWGGGWLAGKGMWDFAGSTVVHSVGGWAALAGVIVLGARLGKFGKDGKVHPIPGHNMTSVFIGVFILWLGWFGFNPGSTMGLGDGKLVGHIFITTNLAAAAGSITALCAAWLLLRKPDFTMIANGCLAGLVAITAPCAFVTAPCALIIGAIAGVLVVLSVLMFDRVKLDDPVGALSVHLVNGIWGTLAVGLFAYDAVQPGTTGNGLFFGGGSSLLVAQFIGVMAVGGFTFVGSWVIWVFLRETLGLRVSEEEEIDGLDYGEHGNHAYPDFVVTQPVAVHNTGGQGHRMSTRLATEIHVAEPTPSTSG